MSQQHGKSFELKKKLIVILDKDELNSSMTKSNARTSRLDPIPIKLLTTH